MATCTTIRKILLHLVNEGPSTRAEIEQTCGTKASNYINALEYCGAIVVVGKQEKIVTRYGSASRFGFGNKVKSRLFAVTDHGRKCLEMNDAT